MKPEASVVVPTKDRPSALARCTRALSAQRTRRTFEVIVVNDAHARLGEDRGFAEGLELRVLDGGRPGPAAARNVGVRASQGKYVLFTDDDTAPASDWVETTCRFLDAHPEHIAVSGVTESPRYDPLYEHSLEVRGPSYWTCNIAYRRDVLDALGGFFEGFGAACEDLDLGYRAVRLGSIGFCVDMRITHLPHPISLRAQIGRGRLAASELTLYARHRDRYPTPPGVPLAALPVASAVSRWAALARAEGFRLVLRPRRLGRFVVASSGQLVIALATTVGAVAAATHKVSADSTPR